jgi:hypothetical protein
VDGSALIHGQRGTVFRATVQLPLVFTHPDELIEVPSAIRGLGERDVAHAAGKDVPPRRVHSATRVNRHRGFAAETYAGGNQCFDAASVRRENAVIHILRRLAFVGHS